MNHFDVIVVGAGHAGVEAALAAARIGVSTLVVTTNLERIGYMSCNPSIGGLGKGHMVKEIDVLGGLLGYAADQNCVQFKRLNSRKGPAVRGTRMQEDKDKYCKFVGNFLTNHPNMKVLEEEVKALVLEEDVCRGVVLGDGSKVLAKSVVITTGTFMNAVMHIGTKKISGGRVGDKASIGLSDQLDDFGFEVTRLKTGTPPRLKRSSIDFSKTTEEFGDSTFIPFSYRSEADLKLKQISCYLTYTNEKTHEIINKNIHLSPMFSGEITGTGPRYCPSIEDKITRFSDKPKHQSFLEPEGVDSDIIYLQGISTSLPEDVQMEFLRTIDGLENVEVIRPGYAVEYDFVNPTQLNRNLETKKIKNLFLAGQINGTSGYEEAAGQGLVAGVNAANKVLDREDFILDRFESYIGVLIDDLVTKGTKEPYRMFTSRAEHRLMLREDNAMERLFKKATQFGLLNTLDRAKAEELISQQNSYYDYLNSQVINPTKEVNSLLSQNEITQIVKPYSLAELLRRPEVGSEKLRTLGYEVPLEFQVYDSVEIKIKYKGYIDRQNELIRQASKLEGLKLPKDLSYKSVKGLSNEEIEKLISVQPETLGQASRISGVNPSAIQALMIYLKAYQPPKSLRH